MLIFVREEKILSLCKEMYDGNPKKNRQEN